MRKIAKLPKPRNPFTPTVRRFLHDIFKPTVAPPTLGKRAREDEQDENTRPAPPPPAAGCQQPACVALQNEDTDEDAIVITALDVVPFCCHADLITMPRISLIAVARSLNTKLPAALQIDVGPTRSDLAIRAAIELLVGLRNVPPAPRANKSLSVADLSVRPPVSPGSPLAAKSRSSASLGTPGLAVLKEEDETSGSSWEGRTHKRRRLALQQADKILPFDADRRYTRSQSALVDQSRSGSPPSAIRRRMLRSRTERAQKKSDIGAHPNITVARGRYDSRAESVALTSTPKRMWRESSVSTLTSGQTHIVMPASFKANQPATPTQTTRGKKRKAEDTMDTSEMTFAIHGMTIAHNDVSSRSAMSMIVD